MAATTGQLGLVTPTQGDLSGTWGNTVNNGITEYTNIAIAGTLTLTGDGAVTLANTTGDASATNITASSTLAGAGTATAQFALVKVTGTLTTTKVVTFGSAGSAPYSKTYTVVNAATGGSVSFTAYGGTGVTIAVGESAYVYYDGTNIVKVSSTVASGVTTFSAGTTGFTPSTATSGAVTLAGTLALANGGTAATSAPAAMASLMGFTSTATAAGTTTLTNTSSYYQQFTGVTTQTVTLPVTSTLVTGWTFHIVNNSTGNVTVNSSGANLVITVLPGTTAMCTCIATSTTTAADWESGLTDFSTATGTGSVVLATSPTLTTPALGTPASGTLSSCTVDGTNKVGYLNIPNSGAKTTSYTLAIGDVGKFIELGTSGSVVVPASVFAAGDAISIFNNTSGSISCTCSAVTTVYKGGTDADISSFSVTTRGVATILFITATVAVVTGNLA